jgi:hypothetical protein
MIKKKIILIPTVTILILLSVFISFAYGIILNKNNYNNNNNYIIIILFSIVFIITIFNIFMLIQKQEVSHKLNI